MIFTETELQGLADDIIMKHMPERGPWHIYQDGTEKIIPEGWIDSMMKAGKNAVFSGKVIAHSTLGGSKKISCVPFVYLMTVEDHDVSLKDILAQDLPKVIPHAIEAAMFAYHLNVQVTAAIKGGDVHFASALGTVQVYDPIGDGPLLASTGFILRAPKDRCVVCSAAQGDLNTDIPAFEIAKYMGDIMDAEGNLYKFGPEDRGMDIQHALTLMEQRARRMN